jgi:hypothetical protein
MIAPLGKGGEGELRKPGACMYQPGFTSVFLPY